jgi:hypothetical protein
MHTPKPIKLKPAGIRQMITEGYYRRGIEPKSVIVHKNGEVTVKFWPSNKPK